MADNEVKYNLPGVKPSDWTIGELYNQSWSLVKKHKVLWLFGMAVAAFSGGGFNFSNFSNFSGLGGSENKEAPVDQLNLDSLDSIPGVLGSQTSALTDTFSSLFSGVPVVVWVFLFLQIIVLVFLGWFISLIARSWSTAGLIQAIQLGLEEKNISIKDASAKAFASIKPLALLFFIPGLLFFISFLALFGILALGFALTTGVLKVVVVVLLIFASLALIYFWIYLTLSQIWAQRQIVLDQKQWREALFSGYRISRRKKWSMLLLGLVNMIFSSFLVLIPVLILAMVGISGFALKDSLPALGWSLLGVAGLLVITFIFAYTLLSGILTAFKATIWTIAYHKIRGKYDAI